MGLRGIAWDHRRCWGPLEATAGAYRDESGQDVRWDRRSLYSFGEGDLADICRGYDLVIYDHPFVGQAAEEGWLLDLSSFLSDADRRTFDDQQVGPSWQSYAHRGGIYGLPIDTAAQTAAWRPDLLDAPPPGTLHEVLALAGRLRGQSRWIAWPAIPTDQMCTLLSVAASLGLSPGRGGGPFLALADAEEVLGWLRRLLDNAHPSSATWNPIRCLDHMAATDEVAYVPYLFNYVTYATPGPEGRVVRFGPSPRVRADRPSRTVLGGAGIGVSASSADPAGAVAYALWLCRPDFQADGYVRHGGQPGLRSAWVSPEADEMAAGFFSATLPALDASYLRPTYAGFLPLFHEATARLDAVLRRGAPARPFVEWLNAEHDRHAAAAEAAA